MCIILASIRSAWSTYSPWEISVVNRSPYDTLSCMSWFIYAVLAAFLTSLSAMVEKRSLSHLHAIDFSIILSLFAAALSAPALFLYSWETIDGRVIALLLAVSLLATIAFIGVIRGVRHLEVSTSASLFLLGPFLTSLIAYLFLGETLSPIQLGGMLLLALGIYILETKHFFRGGEFWKNIWGDKYSRFIILGMLLYGFTSTGDRIALGYLHVPAVLYTALVQLFIAGFFILVAFYYRRGLSTSYNIAKTEWKLILLVAVLTTGYRVMQSQAAALAAIGLVIAIKRSSALFTTVVGGELFREHDLIRKTIACTIMIGGVYLIAMN